MNRMRSCIILFLFATGMTIAGCGVTNESSKDTPTNDPTNNQSTNQPGNQTSEDNDDPSNEPSDDPTDSTDDTTADPPAVTLAGSRQGHAVGFADVDGDGFDDKIVGAPYATSPGGSLGAVLVYKGAAGGYNAEAAGIITGDDNLGYSMARLGDIDGDGMEEIAVGAIHGSGDGVSDPSMAGTVTVFKGGSPVQVMKKITGEEPMDKFGFSIAAGDLNADGHTDLAIGSPFHTGSPDLYQQGAVHVRFGPGFESGLSLKPSAANKGLGWAVATGDINGDNIADLLVSASGKVLAWYGGASFAPVIASPDVAITCSASGFGKSVAVVGDLDGDGLRETAIGAPNATINGNRDTGSLYIVKGGTGTRSINVGAATPPSDLLVRIDGSGLFDRFGMSIAVVGDIDGDTLPDIAAGAPMSDVFPRDLSGRVFLFKGKDTKPGATLASSTAFPGVTKNQGYGASLAASRSGRLMIGAPRSGADAGGVAMVDPATGQAVPGGSSGGTTGGGDSCH